jgi:hypothetical protein
MTDCSVKADVNTTFSEPLKKDEIQNGCDESDLNVKSVSILYDSDERFRIRD